MPENSTQSIKEESFSDDHSEYTDVGQPETQGVVDATTFVRNFYSQDGIFLGEDQCYSNVGRMMDAIRQRYPDNIRNFRYVLLWKKTRISSEGLPFARVREGQEQKAYLKHALLLDNTDHVYDLYGPEDLFGATIEDYIKGAFDKSLMQLSIPDEFGVAIANAQDFPHVGQDGIIRFNITDMPSTKIVSLREFAQGKTS